MGRFCFGVLQTLTGLCRSLLGSPFIAAGRFFGSQVDCSGTHFVEKQLGFEFRVQF